MSMEDRNAMPTEAMVEAALEACPLNYFQPRGDGTGYVRCSVNTDDIRLMLSAALAHPGQVREIAIKPLEWDECTQARSDEDPHREVVGYEAASPVGIFYGIRIEYDGFHASSENDCLGCFESLEEAQAAAQADFEQRIRSALALPLPVQESGSPNLIQRLANSLEGTAAVERLRGQPKDPNGPEPADSDLFPSNLDPFSSLSRGDDRTDVFLGIPIGEIVAASSPAAELLYGRDVKFYESMRTLPIGTKLYASPEVRNAEREFIAQEARRYASFYPEASDGRNTFIVFAEMIEARVTASEGSTDE